MKNSQVNWFASFLTELHGVQKCPSIRAGLHYDFTIRSPLGPLVLAALRQYLGAPMSAMSRKKVERIDAWHEGQSEFLAMSSDSEGKTQGHQSWHAVLLINHTGKIKVTTQFW